MRFSIVNNFKYFWFQIDHYVSIRSFLKLFMHKFIFLLLRKNFGCSINRFTFYFLIYSLLITYFLYFFKKIKNIKNIKNRLIFNFLDFRFFNNYLNIKIKFNNDFNIYGTFIEIY